MHHHFSRARFVAAVAGIIAIPATALASRQDDKRKFISQCDESISVDRLAGAPFKFIGKKVDLHGVVGPAASEEGVINLNSDNGNFVVVLGPSRNLEQHQRIRVLGTVQKPISGQNTAGGSGTYAVVRSAFIE